MTLFNRCFAVRHLDGRTDRREVRDAEDYRTTLAEAFGLTLHENETGLLMGALDERPASAAPRPFFV